MRNVECGSDTKFNHPVCQCDFRFLSQVETVLRGTTDDHDMKSTTPPWPIHLRPQASRKIFNELARLGVGSFVRDGFRESRPIPYEHAQATSRRQLVRDCLTVNLRLDNK